MVFSSITNQLMIQNVFHDTVGSINNNDDVFHVRSCNNMFQVEQNRIIILCISRRLGHLSSFDEDAEAHTLAGPTKSIIIFRSIIW